MTTNATPASSAGGIVVAVALDPELGAALDRFCARTYTPRAAFTRRLIVEALRSEGMLPSAAIAPGKATR
jgi:hypothetical protein